MEINRQISVVAFLLILLINVSASAQEYILPEPDYRPDNEAKACIDGIIISVEKGKITVSGINHHGKDEIMEIIINGKIFTIYGGYVSPDQLVEGIKLKIWFKGSSCDLPAQPITSARIIVASQRPGDDWP